jgi:lipopolysaccharide/colanic/teichoic acid biosynthesis glycosyltransferase
MRSTLKRLFDLVCAGVGLVVLWPFLVVIGILIKLDDGGPAFFRQERIGHQGRPFLMWKFRTMKVNADKVGGPLTVGADPRVTRIGQWLRKLKLDELPQLLNVVAGDMSLVGPRPEVARYVDLYTVEQRKVLELLPGITDPASVKYRNESELLGQSDAPEHLYVQEIMPEKIRINLEYARRATLLSDIMVILSTFVKVAAPTQ